MRSKAPVLLTILDGWGYRAESAGNAIALARKPAYDALLRDYPNTLIRASDHFVGLPDGQMGNSEVGHLNLGAGRVVRMDITRIDAAIASGEFFEDATLVTFAALLLIGCEGQPPTQAAYTGGGGIGFHQDHRDTAAKSATYTGQSASAGGLGQALGSGVEVPGNADSPTESNGGTGGSAKPVPLGIVGQGKTTNDQNNNSTGK